MLNLCPKMRVLIFTYCEARGRGLSHESISSSETRLIFVCKVMKFFEI